MNDWVDRTAGASIAVIEETKSAKVVYGNDKGQTFGVVIYQKPNPIGFLARLPGDRRARPRTRD